MALPWKPRKPLWEEQALQLVCIHNCVVLLEAEPIFSLLPSLPPARTWAPHPRNGFLHWVAVESTTVLIWMNTLSSMSLGRGFLHPLKHIKQLLEWRCWQFLVLLLLFPHQFLGFFLEKSRVGVSKIYLIWVFAFFFPNTWNELLTGYKWFRIIVIGAGGTVLKSIGRGRIAYDSWTSDSEHT